MTVNVLMLRWASINVQKSKFNQIFYQAMGHYSLLIEVKSTTHLQAMGHYSLLIEVKSTTHLQAMGHYRLLIEVKSTTHLQGTPFFVIYKAGCEPTPYW
jgi:DNA-binding sugar fermentation-stimulating protein